MQQLGRRESLLRVSETYAEVKERAEGRLRRQKRTLHEEAFILFSFLQLLSGYRLPCLLVSPFGLTWWQLRGFVWQPEETDSNPPFLLCFFLCTAPRSVTHTHSPWQDWVSVKAQTGMHKWSLYHRLLCGSISFPLCGNDWKPVKNSDKGGNME